MPENYESQLRAYDLIEGNSILLLFLGHGNSIRAAYELTFLQSNNLASVVNRSAS